MATVEHQSSTCTLGPNATRCEMCAWAERVTRRRQASRIINRWIARENARRKAGEMIERAIDVQQREMENEIHNDNAL